MIRRPLTRHRRRHTGLPPRPGSVAWSDHVHVRYPSMLRHSQVDGAQNWSPMQAPLQAGSHRQLQLSRSASWVLGQPSATASHTQPQAPASKTNPGAQVAFSRQSQVQAAVLQVSKPPQVALQSRAQAGSQRSRSQLCRGDGRPPQSSGHTHCAFKQTKGDGQSPHGSLPPSGLGERSIQVRYEMAISRASAGRQSPMSAMELLAAS